ncbi:hypothetical protein CBM2587_P10040 [Cupriavidus taiwanensis]|uniref:Uncharacterized protein n=1 Tax=Cupriavidus taiwanensis TaxID=164546 RepID=A0A975XIS8_9BURK|nr:hypothetical protein CBM2587_P10040 [Cupriavidus taiwanensis]
MEPYGRCGQAQAALYPPRTGEESGGGRIRNRGRHLLHDAAAACDGHLPVVAARQAARRCHGRRVSHWGGHERHARVCLHPRAQPNTGRLAFPGRRLAVAGGQEEGMFFVESAVTHGPIAAFSVNDEDAAGRVSSARQARLCARADLLPECLGSRCRQGKRRRRGPRD